MFQESRKCTVELCKDREGCPRTLHLVFVRAVFGFLRVIDLQRRSSEHVIEDSHNSGQTRGSSIISTEHIRLHT